MLAGHSAALAVLPPIEVLAQGLASNGHNVLVQQAELAEFEHNLGHAASHEGHSRRVVNRADRHDGNDARHGAVDASPILNGRTLNASGESDSREVQQQVSGATEGCVNDHGILDSLVGNDVLGGNALVLEVEQRTCRSASDVLPHSGARRSKCRVRDAEAQALGHNLRGTSGAQELAAATSACASMAALAGSVLEGDLVVSKTSTNGLNGTSVLAVVRHQGRAAGAQNGGQVMLRSKSHHHCR